MPIPWMKTIGSFDLEVCGRCQYVIVSDGDTFGASRLCGRGGMTLKNREIGVR